MTAVTNDPTLACVMSEWEMAAHSTRLEGDCHFVALQRKECQPIVRRVSATPVYLVLFVRQPA